MKIFRTHILITLATAFIIAGCGCNNTQTTNKEVSEVEQAQTIREALPDSLGHLVRLGEAVPQFTIEYYDGRVADITSLRGRVVLINFWTTWCPYCVAEFKAIPEGIIERYADREDFSFVAIDRGEERGVIHDFMQSNGYDTIPAFASAIAFDRDSTIFNMFAQRGVPRNYLLDRRGNFVYLGLDYNEEEFARLQNAIDNALEKQ